MRFFRHMLGRDNVAQPDGLISVLLDFDAPLDDRDDAAMDLAEFDEALPVLLAIASRPSEDEMIVEKCGESIGEIWKRTTTFDRTIFETLPPKAQFEILGLFPEETRK